MRGNIFCHTQMLNSINLSQSLEYMTIVLKANREDIKTNLPRYFRTCIFCKCSNIDDECILFSIVKETNVTKKKTVCPSSIEVTQLSEIEKKKI